MVFCTDEPFTNCSVSVPCSAVVGAVFSFAEVALCTFVVAVVVVVPVTGLEGLEVGVAVVGVVGEEEVRLLPLGTVVAVTMPRGMLEEAEKNKEFLEACHISMYVPSYTCPGA